MIDVAHLIYLARLIDIVSSSIPAATELLVRLAETSWQAGLMAVIVGLACHRWPQLPAGLRVALWWIVCFKFVVSLAWPQPVTLPLLPAAVAGIAGTAQVERPATAVVLTESGRRTTAANTDVDDAADASWPATARTATRIGVLVLASLWVLGVIVQALLLGRQLIRTRALVARAQPVDADVARRFDALRVRVGLSTTPRLRASLDIATPQVTGLLRPVVLLPEAALMRWSEADLSMTLCHELMHIRRRDLWHGWIPSAAARLFAFHPLARLAAGEYALAREAACDAHVLRLLGAAPDDYGRLLLRLGVAPRDAAPAAAGASTSLHTLKRRLIMLHDASLHARTLTPRWWIVAAIAAVAVLPVRLVAQPASPPPVAPQSVVLQSVAPQTVALQPAAPDRVAAQTAVQSAAPAREWKKHDAWVLLDGDATYLNGDVSYIEEAKRLRANPSERLLWFLRDGRAYVIRDQNLLSAARIVFEPQQRLGDEQQALAERQKALGAEQVTLTRRRRELEQSRQELLTRANAESAQLTKALEQQAAKDNQELREHRAALETQLQSREAEMRALDTMREEARQNLIVTEQQHELGVKQEILGRLQQDLSVRMTMELRELLDKAFSQGLVLPVR